MTWLVCLAVCYGKHPSETCHLCPVLVTTISPVMRALQRLMSFSDVTMCYLLLTTVGLHSTFWYAAICLSVFCLLCYPTSLLFLHLAFSFIPPISEDWAFLKAAQDEIFMKNITGTYIHFICPNSMSPPLKNKSKHGGNNLSNVYRIFFWWNTCILVMCLIRDTWPGWKS